MVKVYGIEYSNIEALRGRESGLKRAINLHGESDDRVTELLLIQEAIQDLRDDKAEASIGAQLDEFDRNFAFGAKVIMRGRNSRGMQTRKFDSIANARKSLKTMRKSTGRPANIFEVYAEPVHIGPLGENGYRQGWYIKNFPKGR